MPGKTAKQRRYMGWCANTKPKPKGCPSREVAREFARKPKKRATKKA